MKSSPCYEAECVDRIADPNTHKTVALWGWITETRDAPRKYWVSIEDSPVEFFETEARAQGYYEIAIERIKNRFRHREYYARKQAVRRLAAVR